jgi:hypothetical protein
MYLDFIQLKDVYNYLYQLKPADKGGLSGRSSVTFVGSDKVCLFLFFLFFFRFNCYQKGKQETDGNSSGERTMLIFPGQVWWETTKKKREKSLLIIAKTKQGAQKVGMGQGLDKQFPEAKELFEKAKAILGYDLYDICVNVRKETK